MTITDARRLLIELVPVLSGRYKTAIGMMLATSDAVPCKDCKHCSHKTFETPTGMVDTYQCKRAVFGGHIYLDTEADDFCSRGVR